MENIKVAVVVGQHFYNVPALQDMFMSLEGITAYIQNFEEFVGSGDQVRAGYDVILFYTIWQDEPTNNGPWYAERQLDVLNSLGKTGQGIFVMHHSFIAFPDWPDWRLMVGVENESYKGYHLDQNMNYHIVDLDHPITAGLEDFAMIDEAYEMAGVSEDDGNHILITTDHPLNIATIAWTRKFKDVPVFCFQSGHDEKSFENSNFRKIMRQGILWLAGNSTAANNKRELL